MKKFSARPTLTLKGRKFKGPRGWSGKPSHPPLTDIPIAAFVIAAVFDVISVVGGEDNGWAGEFWHAATFLFVAGLAVAVLAALTGLADAKQSSEAGTQARRTINTHAAIMVAATVLAVVNTVWRLNVYNTEPITPVALMILSVVVALLVALGATFGGALVFEYGFNVETAGDHPVWHRSETDVFPGRESDHSDT